MYFSIFFNNSVCPSPKKIFCLFSPHFISLPVILLQHKRFSNFFSHTSVCPSVFCGEKRFSAFFHRISSVCPSSFCGEKRFSSFFHRTSPVCPSSFCGKKSTTHKIGISSCNQQLPITTAHTPGFVICKLRLTIYFAGFSVPSCFHGEISTED